VLPYSRRQGRNSTVVQLHEMVQVVRPSPDTVPGESRNSGYRYQCSCSSSRNILNSAIHTHIVLQAPVPEAEMEDIDWTKCEDVERIPGNVSGSWLVKDTRLPV